VFVVVLGFIGVGVGMVVVAEILMYYFFKKEKHPYSNDDDKILVHCGWVVTVTGMVTAVTGMVMIVGVILMATRAHVRQSVEEYISKKTAKSKT
jgi:predicted cation transporter